MADSDIQDVGGIVLRSKHLAQRAITRGSNERRAALKLLPEGVVAQQLGVSLSTLRVWRRRGEGPRHAKLGRLVRYRPEDVLMFLEERTSMTSGTQS